MNKVLKYSFGVMIVTFSILGVVYAASTITGLGQTINDGDTIGAGWFNEVSSVLGGPKSDGKICSYAAGKISCVNDLPVNNLGILQEGKWCTVKSSKIECTENPPFNTSGIPTCTSSQSLSYNGTSFECKNIPGSSLTSPTRYELNIAHWTGGACNKGYVNKGNIGANRACIAMVSQTSSVKYQNNSIGCNYNVSNGNIGVCSADSIGTCSIICFDGLPIDLN